MPHSICKCTLAKVIIATVNTSRSRIHELTISLRSQGIILRVLRLEVSGFCFHYKPALNHFCSRGRGKENPLVDVTVNGKEVKSYDCCPSTSNNSASGFKKRVFVHVDVIFQRRRSTKFLSRVFLTVFTHYHGCGRKNKNRQ
jgi:hypothetical protein